MPQGETKGKKLPLCAAKCHKGRQRAKSCLFVLQNATRGDKVLHFFLGATKENILPQSATLGQKGRFLVCHTKIGIQWYVEVKVVKPPPATLIHLFALIGLIQQSLP